MKARRRPLAPAQGVTVDYDEGTLTVRRLDPTEWQEVVDRHPCPPGAVGWDPETFPPDLIAASVTALDGQPLSDTDRAAVGASVWAEWTADAAHAVYEQCLRLSSPRPLSWARARLDRDPRLSLEVAYCAGVGLQPSVFAQWPDRDRDLILAAYVRQRTACPGCGSPWESMTDYNAHLTVEQRECVWCEQRDLAQASIPEDRRGTVHTYIAPDLDDGDTGEAA